MAKGKLFDFAPKPEPEPEVYWHMEYLVSGAPHPFAVMFPMPEKLADNIYALGQMHQMVINQMMQQFPGQLFALRLMHRMTQEEAQDFINANELPQADALRKQ